MGAKKRRRLIVFAVTLIAGIYLAGTFTPVGECCFFAKSQILVPEKPSGFTPIQISTVPQLGGGIFKADTPVYGMSVGGMVHQKEINGVSVAGIHAFTKRKSGVSFSLMDVCEESRGASFFAAGGAERLQTLQRGGAQRFAGGDDYGVVRHFSDPQRRVAGFALHGQQ